MRIIKSFGILEFSFDCLEHKLSVGRLVKAKLRATYLHESLHLSHKSEKAVDLTNQIPVLAACE